MEILHNNQETVTLQTLSLFQILAIFLKTLYISWDATRILRTHCLAPSKWFSQQIDHSIFIYNKKICDVAPTFLEKIQSKYLKVFQWHFEKLWRNPFFTFFALTSLSRCDQKCCCDVHSRDDWILDFHYPILSCFGKLISVSNAHPVFVEIILSVSENYPKVYCDAQHTFLCCVYFASWGKITAGAILPLASHDWLK